MPAVEPDKRWAPSLSCEYGAFHKPRDVIECFPEVDKVVIHIENDDGLQIANDALSTLNLTGRKLEDMKFLTLWSGYERTKRMMELRGDCDADQFQVLFAAYHVIAGHIRATCSAEYEEARLSRLEK